MTLKTDVDKLAVDAALVHDWAHGGTGTTVTTEGGPVRSPAKLINDKDAEINQGAGSILQQATDQATASAGSAANAAASASQAAASASSAASVVQQDLSAIDRVAHTSTSIVDVALYDTGADSDGGLWRKRCQRTSWYNESVNGVWLGEAANEAGARAVSGATTTDYYHNTTDGKFYKLNAGSGQTEVFRGNKREFPPVALIVAESARVVIFDLTETKAPMWMVFTSGVNFVLNGGTVSSVAAANGTVVIGNSDAVAGSAAVTFPGDRATLYRTAATGSFAGTMLSGRNASFWTSPRSAGIAANAVKDVAAAALPDAPIDLTTGLPVPTLALATTSGVSVVHPDGTVADFSLSDSPATSSVGFLSGNLTFRSGGSGDAFTLVAPGVPRVSSTAMAYNVLPAGWSSVYYIDVASTFVFGGSSTGRWAACVAGYTLARSGNTRVDTSTSNALDLLRLDLGAPRRSLGAQITTAYTTGWLPGLIKGAWLAGIVAETLAGTELVTNGGFPADASGWTANNGATLSVAAGELTVTNAGATAGGAVQAITTVTGRTYTVSCRARVGTASPVVLKVGTAAGGSTLGSSSTTSASNTTLAVTFVAAGATTYLTLENDPDSGGTGIYDTVSCRQADADRTTKNAGLQVFGSIIKAAVAAAAQLVGYSGWSVANYLEHPITANLDVGTGDVAFLFALKEAPNSADEVLFERAYYTAGAYSGARIRCEVLAAGTLKLTIHDGTNSASITTTGTVDDSAWRAGLLVGRRAGVLYIRQGDVDLAAPVAAGTVGSLTNANAVLRVGLGVDGLSPLTNGTLTLLRATATFPSAVQNRYIADSEQALFQTGAPCTLAGTSSDVLALAWDEKSARLHVGTAWGRSEFSGLVRVASEVSPVGSSKAVAASDGQVIQAGTLNADVYVPAKLLREELNRDAEQSMVATPDPQWFDGFVKSSGVTITTGPETQLGGLTAHPFAVGDKVACANFDGANAASINAPAAGYHTVTRVISSSAIGIDLNSSGLTITAGGDETVSRKGFLLPSGLRAKVVYDNGALRRPGSTKDYTLLFDGFRDGVLFATAPANGNNVGVQTQGGSGG